MHSAAPQNLDKSIKEGYEVSDMNAKIIVIFLVGLFLLMAGSCVVIVMLIRGFNTSRPPLDTTPASRLATAGMQVPQKPHLQGDPIADRIAIIGENQRFAASYGVVSEEPGMERVRIPVDRAIELLAEGKAPYRQEPAPAALAPEDPFADSPAPGEPEDPFAEDAAPAETPAAQ